MAVIEKLDSAPFAAAGRADLAILIAGFRPDLPPEAVARIAAAADLAFDRFSVAVVGERRDDAGDPRDGFVRALIAVGPQRSRTWADDENEEALREAYPDGAAAAVTVEPVSGALRAFQLDQVTTGDFARLAEDLARRVHAAVDYEATRREQMTQGRSGRVAARQALLALSSRMRAVDEPGKTFVVKKIHLGDSKTEFDLALARRRDGFDDQALFGDLARFAAVDAARAVLAAIERDPASTPSRVDALTAWVDGRYEIARDGAATLDGAAPLYLRSPSGMNEPLPPEGAACFAGAADLKAGAPIFRTSPDAAPETTKWLAGIQRSGFAGAVERSILARLDEMTLAAADVFGSDLDKEAFAAAFVGGAPHLGLYNHHHAEGDARRRERRLQAAAAFPAFRTLLPELPETVDAIDAGRPLLPVLGAELQASAASLRHLRGIDPAHLPSEEPASIRTLVEGLNAIRPDHFPGRGSADPGAQWRAFHETWKALSAVTSEAGLASAPVMRLERPDWLRGEEAPLRDLVEIRDAVRGFSRHVLVPLALDELSRDPAYSPASQFVVSQVHDALGQRGWSGRIEVLSEAVFKGKSLSRIEDLSRRWHQQGGEIGRALAGDGKKSATLVWPPLSAETAAVSGVRVVPLSDDAALCLESDAMDHCVGRGDYLPKCLYDRVHILALRAADGTPLSTAEVELVPDGRDGKPPSLVVLQHRGRSNKEPPAAAILALAAYAKDVQQGRVAVDVRGLEEAREARCARRGENAIVEMVGYDPKDWTTREAMFKAYAFMLPRNERDLTLADWAADRGLRDLIRANLASARQEKRAKQAALANGGEERAA